MSRNIVCIDLEKFLAEHTIPENIVAVNFRCKKHQQSAMEGYRLEIQYKDGQTEELIPEKCAYYKAYFSGNSICETCTRCRFAYGNRVADVTLGDYIPIELAEQKTLNIKGNSLVILNTQKGRTFFQQDLQSDTSMVTRRVSEKMQFPEITVSINRLQNRQVQKHFRKMLCICRWRMPFEKYQFQI